MTFEKCQAILAEIRRRQGTPHPVVQVQYGAAFVRGRVSRADFDGDHPHNPSSPYGVLVLDQLGLARGPATFLQIANIPEDGLREPSEN
jgi:hypothetical protein